MRHTAFLVVPMLAALVLETTCVSSVGRAADSPVRAATSPAIDVTAPPTNIAVLDDNLLGLERESAKMLVAELRRTSCRPQNSFST
jgi:hypothetical protein